MILDKVLHVARPYLEKRTIKDAVLGLAMIGIELDNGHIGLAYMLREDLPPGCSIFGFAQDLIGANAYQVAKLVRDGANDAERGVGIATLTAASRQPGLLDIDNSHSTFGVDVLETDTVGMVGYIETIAKDLQKRSKALYVFDDGISKYGENQELVYRREDQAKLLPTCDVVLITGTSVINGSIDGLLKLCSKAREVVIVGSSTPMFPQAFKDTRVTVLAGSWWDNKDKDDLFKVISLAGGIAHVKRWMIKKAIKA